MECGIGNKTDRNLVVSINGCDRTVESGDGFYVELPEDKTASIKVKAEEKEEEFIKKLLMWLYHFFLSPVVIFTRANELELKQAVGLTTEFQIKPTESISLTEAEESFALCKILTENRLYEGELNYTAEELKKEIKSFLIPALLTVLGAAVYLFLIILFIKNKTVMLFVTVAAAGVLPALWLVYKALQSYRDLKKKLESEESE